MNQNARDRLRDITRHDPADLGTAALLIEAALTATDDAHADRILAEGHDALDRLAEAVPGDGSDHQRLSHALGTLHGTPEDYRRLESSLLGEVLVRERGLSILLSVVWLEVARRVGIGASGLAIPGHFVVAVGTSHEQSLSADVIAGTCIVTDPFAGGRTLELPDIEALAQSHSPSDAALDPVRLLAPAAPVDILHRILRNIRTWADRPERLTVALASCELGLALSRHPLELERQRAELLARTGQFVEASDAYAEYADHVEPADAEGAERARILGRLARARLN